MSVIRRIEVDNFRALKRFEWLPSAGINCLIGPGDSGKSSILDAIDFCIGARRNLQIADTDFHCLNVGAPIQISITLGELDDQLKTIDAYGLYLRAFDASTGAISDEPEAEQETVLTVQLAVQGDLEPQWTLVSERATAQSQTRNLNWNDRVRLAPTRLGAFDDHNLSWRRGSILNRLSEERADASAALVKAARDVREGFGEQAKEQLAEALQTVLETAVSLGIPVGAEVKAMLDAHSVSFSGGTISLHDERGVPLKALGLGSTRLLIAGLQRCAANESSIVLIDELEHGLEPHRIIRLIDALGAKEQKPPLQVLMTTHSSVAVRELSGSQLYVVRCVDGEHKVRHVGTADEVQGTIRLFPEALLAPSVLVCEGASEVGLVRGLPAHLLPPIALMMFTGLGPKDALTLRRDAYRDGKIALKRSKTGEPVFWPCPKHLKVILEKAPKHDAITLCANSDGRPWTISGYRASWRKVRITLERAGRVGPALTLYGLRHTVAVILREIGYDERTIADALGQKTIEMARHYAKGADLAPKMRGVVKSFDAELNKRSTKIVKPGR